MQSLRIYLLLPILVLFFTACVTINVYFPAAAAEKAADKVIDHVWGKQQPTKDSGVTDTQPDNPEIEKIWGIDKSSSVEEPKSSPVNDSDESSISEPTSSLSRWLIYGLDFLISPAHAKANIDVSTPAIRKIEARLKRRHQKLEPGYNSGAIGLTNDALITLHDPAKIPLKNRRQVNNWIADENKDRLELYRQIAIANGHPEWESKIRAVFAERWIQRAKRGWWYQDKNGRWQRKR